MLEPQNEEEFKMDIGIVGLGVVGTACKNGFEKIGHKVKYHDVKFYTNIEDVLDTEVCFVSVPTPSNEDGSCDISIVEEVVGQLNDLKYKGVLAIKSTVEPGTNKEFREKYKKDPVVSKWVDMAMRIEASKHLVYQAAWRKDNNLPLIKEAAMAKLFASEAAMRICTEAIQIHGGYGYIKEYDVERFFRDAKILEIGEGTSEIQRIIISRNILS